MSLDITCLFRHSTYSIQTDKTFSSLFFILKQREWRWKFTERGFNLSKTSSGTLLVWGRMELWKMYNYIPRFIGSLNSGWRSSNCSYQSRWGLLAGSEVKLLKFQRIFEFWMEEQQSFLPEWMRVTGGFRSKAVKISSNQGQHIRMNLDFNDLPFFKGRI